MKIPSAIIAMCCVLRSRVLGETITFPEGFFFGAGSSAHQIEGGWDADDKSPSTFDVWTHNNPGSIKDGSNADVACDSYHKYAEDVKLVKDLGLDVYRISLSWPRILPNGYDNYVSKAGIEYYRNLLETMKSEGIEPLVTLYHWTHPQILEEMGGWTNELMVKWFGNYARVVFRELGPHVKMFSTMNEMLRFCSYAYGTDKYTLAPGKKLGNYGPYLCVHNMLKAHAEAYHIYDQEFRSTQHGMIGAAFDCNAHLPQDPSNPDDLEAAERGNEFRCGWAAHPIYRGDYPEVMKELVASRSKEEGYAQSRLPEFSESEIRRINETSDFFGLNYYFGFNVTRNPDQSNKTVFDDAGVEIIDEGDEVSLQALRGLLLWIKENYGNPKVFITESGISDEEGLDDYERIHFYRSYLPEIYKSMAEDGCDLIGYCIWSLMDNFEWGLGYTSKFGIYSVDFNSPNRTRTAKRSAAWWKDFLVERKLSSE